MSLRLITFNVQYGRGQDGANDIARCAEVVRGFDIVALQEVERFWDRSGDVDQPARLAELLGDHWTAYGPAVDVLKQRSPGPRGAVRRQFGNMVLSRFPILAVRNLILPRRALITRPTLQRAALEVIIDVRGRLLRVISTHLDHVSPRTRAMQAEALVSILQAAPLEGGQEHGEAPSPAWREAITAPEPPADTVLMGDLNAPSSEPAYETLVGEVDSFYGRLAHADRFADAWLQAGHDEAGGHTWFNDMAQRSDGRRIDYVLVSAGLAPLVRAAEVIDTDVSDHLPVAVTLAL